MAGVSVKLGNVDAVIDIVNTENSQKPIVRPQFKAFTSASEAVTAGASVSIQVV
jgi:hypothetical protein